MDTDRVIAGLGCFLIACLVCCCTPDPYPIAGSDMATQADMMPDMSFQCMKCYGNDASTCATCECIGGKCCCNYNEFFPDMR